MPDMKTRSKDFVGVCGMAAAPTVFVVHSAVPARTLKEFVALAAARPGELNVANPGTGSSIHLAQELFFERTGLRLTDVSYKGQPPALLDLGSGLLQFALVSQNLILPLIRSGKVRPLAVNATTRTRSLPDVPTIAEAGYRDTLVQSWYGVAAPAKTPAPRGRVAEPAVRTRDGHRRGAHQAGGHRRGDPGARCRRIRCADREGAQAMGRTDPTARVPDAVKLQRFPETTRCTRMIAVLYF